MNTSKIIFSIMLVMTIFSASAQNLSQVKTNASVNQMQFDMAGNLYMATSNGVAKMDASKAITVSKAGTNYASVNIGPMGYIGAGSNNNVSIFDGTSWSDNVASGYTDINNISNDTIASPTSYLPYIGGAQGLGYSVDFSPYQFLIRNAGYNMVKNTMFCTYTNSIKHVWIATANNIYDYNRKTGKFYPYSFTNVTCMDKMDVDANMIAVGTTTGAYILTTSDSSKTSISTKNITAIEADASGNGTIWMATSANKIIKRLSNGTTFEFSVPSTVNDIESNNGNLYIGTPNGLYIFNETAPSAVQSVNSGSADTLSVLSIQDATYQWYYNATSPNGRTAGYDMIAGATSNTFVAKASGYYRAEITVNGTTTTSEVMQATVTTTAVKSAELDADIFTVYPNPSNGEFNIHNNEAQITEVVLINSMGASESHKMSDFNVTVNTSMKGMVMVKVITEKGVASKKMILN